MLENKCQKIIKNGNIMRKVIGIMAIMFFACSIVYASNQNKSSEVTKMSEHEKINYVEFPSKNLAVTKAFFVEAFGWSFVDYGPEYIAFKNEGLDGGFFKSDLISSSNNGSALIVLYSNALEITLSKIENTGGKIIKPIFSFPGGRRFHFTDPNGNEYAVWSE
jgi:hypothetical protein